MRVKVILNPWAGRGRAIQYKDKIEEWGQAYGSLDVALTERPGHARELARLAAEEGYDVVAAAGGDGTPHEVVNGLVRGDRAEATLGVIPIGSGNDLAYALGISTDVETAVRRLFTGQPRTIDLGRVEDDKGRYEIFDNNLGIGFDAVVVIETESITRVHGFLMYLLAVLRAIAFYYQTPHLEIRFDEETVRQKVLFIAMGLGPRGGGGFLLTPDAELDDHLIDSCTVNPVNRLTMLRMLLKVMKGTHVTSRHVTMRQNRRVTITSASMPLPVHVDGEVFAYHQDDVRRLTVTTLPSAVQVMV